MRNVLIKESRVNNLQDTAYIVIVHMIRYVRLVCVLIVLITFNVKAQRFQYFSWSFYGQGSALSNYRTVPMQNQAYFSGGLGYGTSLTNTVNLKVGAHYLETTMNSDKQFHSICDQPDHTCFAESEAKYLNIPIGIEFYSNNSRIKTKSYYHLNLIPMFSMESLLIKSEIYFNENDVELGVDSTLNTNIQFQDIHLEMVLGTDISLTRKLKLFFEPSIQHSILFRKEDLINYNYMISLRLGLRVRSYKR